MAGELFSNVPVVGTEKIYIGVDPGVNGCWAAIDGGGKLLDRIVTPRVGKTGPIDLAEIVCWLVGLLSKYNGTVVATFEDIHPLFGVSASSTGKLMESKGQIEGILYSFASIRGGISVNPMTPKVWQKKVWTPFDHSAKNGKIDTKATSLAAAKRIWPNDKFLATDKSKKPHDGIVDAMLMAEAARRSV